MKKTLLLSFSLLMLLFSCSDSDDNGTGGLTPKEELKKELTAITDKLDEKENLSEFSEVLKSTDLDLATAELTILAAQDRQKTVKSNEGISKENIKRHIIEGVYNFLNMEKDTLQLKSVDGTIIHVMKIDKDIYVNGVKMVSSQAEKVSKSIILIVEDVLPKEYTPEAYKYSLNIEAKLCKEGAENIENPYLAAEKLGIHFFIKQDGDYQLVDSVQTDGAGKAVFKHNIEDTLYYTIRNENVTNTINKCIIKGVFLSQSEIDEYPKYDFYYSNYKATVGGYKLEDLNGDGKVDESDAITSKYLPIDKDSHLNIFVGEVYSSSLPDFWWTTEQDVSNYSRALSSVWGEFIFETFTVNKILSSNRSYLYPALSGVGDYLYTVHYQYINRYHMIDRYLPDFSPFIKDLWETKYKDRHVADEAIMYITMVDYFGAIPLITTYLNADYDKSKIKRDPIADIEAYAEEAMRSIKADDKKHGVMQVLARHYLNEGKYEKALNYAKEIIDSGKYSLDTDSLKACNSSTSPEIILTGIGTQAKDYKADYIHAARYTETLLIACEAYFKLGRVSEALTYYNMVEKRSGFQAVPTITLEDIQRQFSREMRQEGLWYMTNAKRWDRLNQLQPNAQPHNNLLPLPQREVDILPNVIQNPGY